MKKGIFSKLKVNVLLYFLLFNVIIICSVWIFQVFFLDSYYQNERIKTMTSYGRQLCATRTDSTEFNAKATQCNSSGIRVFIVRSNFATDVFGRPITENTDELKLITTALDAFVKNGGSETTGLFSSADNSDNAFYYCNESDSTAGGDEDVKIILTCSRAKITEASAVIRREFGIVTIIVVIAAVLLAWHFSVKLSRPVDEMAKAAKKWAQGDQTVDFTPKRSTYSEINGLGEALNYAKDEISKSGALQRDLLANVSHDLKTPLTMIRAYAEMIRDISGENKEKREKHTQVIIDESDRLSMLVNDILNLSKLQSAVDELNETEINLSELTERVIGRFSDYVENKGYTIEEYIAPDLITFADEKKIEQVIYNLLGNSINYTGEDKTVKVYLTAENDNILLEIIDSGKGISQEKIATIWERYYRFSETNTRPVKGTGLGLSIVKAILDSHKLQFGVRSKKDCGSNFYVKFKRIKNNEQRLSETEF